MHVHSSRRRPWARGPPCFLVDSWVRTGIFCYWLLMWQQTETSETWSHWCKKLIFFLIWIYQNSKSYLRILCLKPQLLKLKIRHIPRKITFKFLSNTFSLNKNRKIWKLPPVADLSFYRKCKMSKSTLLFQETVRLEMTFSPERRQVSVRFRVFAVTSIINCVFEASEVSGTLSAEPHLSERVLLYWLSVMRRSSWIPGSVRFSY